MRILRNIKFTEIIALTRLKFFLLKIKENI
jgi:hypothetical protein